MRTLPLMLVGLAACTPVDLHAPDPNRVDRRVTSAEGTTGDVVSGNSAFAWDLYGQLVEGDANLVFSPLSVSAALGLTFAGAGGETATQMSQVLHVDAEPSAWHTAFGELVDDLNGDKLRGYRLEVANRLFGQVGMPWSEDFLGTCREAWRAPLEEQDFVTDPEAGRDAVNAWVADQTEDRIPELIGPGVITADTKLVLANAVYFLASWWTRFDELATKKADFTRLDGTKVEVDMMWLDLSEAPDNRIRSTATDEAAIVRLPYEDDEVAAYLVIPAEADGLTGLEAQLDADTFASWIAPIEGAGDDEGLEKGQIGLPRFELRWSDSLVPALTALGMTDAFDPLTADFSPMAEGGAADGLVVSDVVHEAWVRVDEQGTEAAAATAVIVNDVSAPIPLVADHPFLLVLRDDLTGSVLFVVRVTDPTGE